LNSLRVRELILAAFLPIVAAAFPVLGIIQQPFMQYVLAGSGLVFLAGKPGTTWIVGWLLLGLVTAWWLPQPLTLAVLCTGLGLAGIVLAGLRLLRPHSPIAATAAVAAPLVPLAFAAWTLVNTFLMESTWYRQPTTFDHAAAAADLRLGGPVSFWLGQLFRAHPWLARVHLELYSALGLVMVGAYAARLQDPRRLRLLGLYVLAGALGLLGYHIMPVVGPLYVFPSFPDPPSWWPALVRVDVASRIPRNAVPSLHLGWALLAALAVRPTIWWFPALTFLGLTVVACLGLGQHYLIDLLIAVPFTMGLWALGQARWWPALAGLATAFGWMALLRTPLAASPFVLVGLPFTAVLVWQLRSDQTRRHDQLEVSARSEGTPERGPSSAPTV
jgi:hypothetical protein